MIDCPECRAQQLVGSLYCLECGGFLIQIGEKDEGEAVDISNQTSHPSTPGAETSEKPTQNPKIALLLLDTQDTIYLTGKGVYTLGRLSEGQTILPDVDLSPFLAYEKGVSRLHAAIRTGSTEIVISDLGSVNGTRINGVKIMPTKAYPIQNQDILNLGKMKIKIIIL